MEIHNHWAGAGSLVFFLLAIGAIVWLIVLLMRQRSGVPSGPTPYRSRALDELDLMYSRGQISREEYFLRRADLTWSAYGGHPTASPASPPPEAQTPAPTPQRPAPAPPDTRD